MKTVIFDLDGTLVDSREDITASINHVREKIYGLEPIDSAFVVEKMNGIGENLAYLFYGVERYEPRARELFERHYARQCLERTKPFPGIPGLLASLKAEGCDLFVATNAPSRTSESILRNGNMDRYFTDIVGADRVVDPKPHPEMIFRILEMAKFEEIWMIGDSAKDMMAAENANVKSIFVKWGYTERLPSGMEKIPTAVEPGEIGRLLNL
ncbi:HAD family hydrolase [Hydrogenimonas sp.]